MAGCGNRPGTAAAAGGRDRVVHGTLDVRDAGQWRAALHDFCGDVALDVLSFLRSPHRPVGRQTRALVALSAVIPDWANRLVVARLTR